MERIDLYDENRVFSGKIINRGEEIPKGLYKLSVHIWVVNKKGDIYIQKRTPNRKKFPNLWENPGGGVLSGETTEEAIVREYKEELNRSLIKKDFKLIKTIKREKDFADIFIVEEDFEIKDLTLQKEEVAEAKWVTLEEINKMIQNNEFVPTIYDSLNPFLEYLENKK